jgi:DNA-binding MarR family transcriptional regulator
MGQSVEAARRQAWSHLSRLFLSDETHDRMHAACEAVRLPHPGSLKALLLLDDDAPLAMRALAGAMHCDASYITGLVDALEERGYVRRKVAAADRRVKLLELTGAGRAAQARALDVMLTPPESLKHLTAAETRTLATLLGKVVVDYPPLP